MKYLDLLEENENLKRALYFRNKEIEGAHKVCDDLDVPKAKSGAWVGHRLYWYYQGKRESNKTSKNTDGYSKDDWKKINNKLKSIRISKKNNKLNII